MQTRKVCLLPGDGIGPEIITEAVKVLDAIGSKHGVCFEYAEGLSPLAQERNWLCFSIL